MSKHSISEAMVMTGGLGTRLRPFTYQRLKCFLPMMGVPLIQYVLDSFRLARVQKVVMNVHYLMSHVKKKVLKLDFPAGEIQISDESQKLLGSAGGIRKAMEYFKSDAFFLSNGDVLCDLDWGALEARHAYLKNQWDVDLTLVVSQKSLLKNSSYARYREIFLDLQKGLVTGLGVLGPECPFYLGMAVVEKKRLVHLPLGEESDFVTAVLKPAIQEKKVGFFLFSGFWYDFGQVASWREAHFSWMRHIEMGKFSSSVSRSWEARVCQVNQRLFENVWVDKAQWRSGSLGTDWTQPCYWSAFGEKGNVIPQLGPQAVYYGRSFSGPLQSGIGIHQDWVEDTAVSLKI